MNHQPIKISSPQFLAMLRFLACIFVWGLFSGQLEAAYKYPIGIPKAWIEPDVVRPARPDPWTAETPGYYYVDNTAGTDSGRTYGTPSAPRKTIPTILGPGTYCEVNGVYNTASGGFSRIQAEADGQEWVATVSGPAWVVGFDADNRASFSSNLLLRGSYLCIEYFDNLAGNGIVQFATTSSAAGYAADHMLMRFSKFDGGKIKASTGVMFAANSTRGASHVVFYNNEVHGYGLYDKPADMPDGAIDPDDAGMRVVDHCHDIWILDCTIYHCAGSGIGCGALPTGPAPTYNIFAARNHIYNVWAAGMAMKTTRNVVYSENLVHDIVWTSWSNAKCIGAQYAFESAWILYNHCYNGDLGIKVGSGAGPNEINVHVIGNLVHDIYDKPEDPSPPSKNGYCGAITIWSGNKRVVVGNTVVNCHNGIVFPSASSNNPYSVVVENNIVADIQTNHLEVDLVASASKWRNNLLFQGDGNVNIKFGGLISVDQANALSYVSDLIIADPHFTDASNKNFSIARGSRAEDAALPDTGLTYDVYAAYLADFGVPINVDIAGRIRPAGAGWDIGAYEGSSSRLKMPIPSGGKYLGPEK